MHGSGSPQLRIGLIGGGQLGRMVAEAASPLDMEIHILDPSADPPAAAGAASHIRAALHDAEAISLLAERCDLVSYEIETTETSVLRRLRVPVEPSPATLEIIQDKLVQRRHLSGAGVPMPEFAPLPETIETVTAAVRTFGFPLVQKVRRGGYDGRGVVVHLHDGAEVVTEATPLPESPISWDGSCYIERAIEIGKELAVMVARSTSGELAVYDPVEMHFDPQLNLVDAVIYPAAVSDEIQARARAVAERAVASLPGAGIFGVELFLDAAGQILVNEIAPRPHNSGHLTIEAAITSQYEQYLRAITGLPLGDTTFFRPAVMRNILGGPTPGETRYHGLSEALNVPGVSLHLYGKRQSHPGRKMGHLTAVGENAWERAEQAWRLVRINGE